ncbi:MAG TPA: DegT/DnrJ/EryC1/StrS family aminotransferase, partial [Chloroflexota bacterium]
MNIPITKPFFGDEERRAIVEPLETGWVVQGPRVAEFERLFAAYTGASHALASTSCTTALHLALIGLGVGPGDEVIVPALTWVATANVVEMLGARPVFVDVELESFNTTARHVEPAITSRTKVIMPVSLFGLSADMEPIVALARGRGVAVIEDDACATGAWYHGQHAGALADVACFSFHPRKAITTGEGGMLTTNDARLATAVQSLRDHGASTSDLARHHGSRPYLLPDFDMVGYNYRMTDFQGALGVVQMGRLEGLLAQRRVVARRYDQALRELPWLRTPAVPEGYQHGYQSYVCLFAPERPSLDNLPTLHERRNALMDRLQQAGVSTRPGTHAVHALGYYRDKYEIAPERFPNALMADHLCLAIPLYAQMTAEEQDYVIAQLAMG